jgi:hypothetical protein
MGMWFSDRYIENRLESVVEARVRVPYFVQFIMFRLQNVFLHMISLLYIYGQELLAERGRVQEDDEEAPALPQQVGRHKFLARAPWRLFPVYREITWAFFARSSGGAWHPRDSCLTDSVCRNVPYWLCPLTSVATCKEVCKGGGLPCSQFTFI